MIDQTTLEAERVLAFAYCKSFAEAQTVTKTWSAITRSLQRSVEYASKEASKRRSAFIGGPMTDLGKGRKDNVHTRTLLTLDYDDFPAGTTVDDVQDALAYNLECTYIAYSTFSHTLEKPRVRVVVPLTEPVDAATHLRLVNWVVGELDLGEPDKASYSTNYLMFLPSHSVGVEPWSYVSHDKGFLDVKSIVGSETYAKDSGPAEADNDLEIIGAMQPIDLTDDQVDVILSNYPAKGLDYISWFGVCVALHHQYQGSEKGFAIFDEWSARDPVGYAEALKKNPPRVKWDSIKAGERTHPMTMRTLIKLSGWKRRQAHLHNLRTSGSGLSDISPEMIAALREVRT
jgi:hypothetical protein